MMARLILVAVSAVAVGGYFARGCFGGGQPCAPEVWPALHRLHRQRRNAPPAPSLPASEGQRDNE